MRELLIRPSNPYDFTNEELEDLCSVLREADAELEVRIASEPERGYGVTPVEAIELLANVGAAGGTLTAAGGALWAAVKWARRRWQKDKEEHPTERPRPRVVLLYGPQGEILKTVKIDQPGGEPVEE